MTPWLLVKDVKYFRKVRPRRRPVWRVDLSRSPTPTIMADGIRSVAIEQHWIEEDGAAMPDIDPTKPPYRVPSMAEIAAVAPTGLTVVSTFAGCGGSSLGYRLAGFRVLWANEFVAAARACYEANKAAATIVDGRDIRDVKPEDILAATGLAVGELDLLDGSPPCASFSTAGRRQTHWGKSKKYSDKSQRTDDLFFEFVRIRDGLMPRAFVAENVSGLVKGVAKGYFLEILAALKRGGYRVEARVLDAQWLGVPQQRQRLIFVGVREDLALEPAFPSPLPYRYSVREAIPWIGRVVQGPEVDQRNEGRELTDRPAPAIVAGDPKKREPRQLQVDAEIVHGNYSTSRAKRGQKIDAGAPLPTVVAGVHGGGPHQFEVCGDAEIVYRGQNGGEPFGERRRSIDEPSATVSKDGYGAAARHQATIVERPHGKFKGRRTDVESQPCPTIRVAGDNVAGPWNTMVEEQSALAESVGAEWDKLHPGQSSDRYFNLVRPDPTAPSPTVTAIGGGTCAAVTHPTERRKFSIAELRRICAFPDDFALSGTYGQQWERLGRAVPPLMMLAIAEVVRDRVLLPARGRPAKKPGPARRLPGRSTKGRRRKGAARSRAPTPRVAPPT